MHEVVDGCWECSEATSPYTRRLHSCSETKQTSCSASTIHSIPDIGLCPAEQNTYEETAIEQHLWVSMMHSIPTIMNPTMAKLRALLTIVPVMKLLKWIDLLNQNILRLMSSNVSLVVIWCVVWWGAMLDWKKRMIFRSQNPSTWKRPMNAPIAPPTT